MGVEAVIFFDPLKAWESQRGATRCGICFFKQPFPVSTDAGYLAGPICERATATQANDNARYLADGLRAARATMLHEPDRQT